MTTLSPPLRVLKGHTVHQRSQPFHHRFRYGLNLIDIDIDRLEDADAQSKVFSIDGPNLFSFRQADHGDRSGENLRNWAEGQFSKIGVNAKDCEIRLVTFARHAFYKFAPISLWLAYGPDQALHGILYEVNNTFGETHIYAATTSDPVLNRHSADKAFHVSPFFDVTGTYEFSLREDKDRLLLVVQSRKDGHQTHVATMNLRVKTATSLQFIQTALIRPFSSLSVSLAIHWQALKLWLKGAQYRSKPTLPTHDLTVASAQHSRQFEDQAA